MCDILHRLMMSNGWNYKWYHAMHQWNMIIQKSNHLILTRHELFTFLWVIIIGIRALVLVLEN
jgi:hypothetical protein